MVDVAVVGAAGYAGIEAVRWVLSHPTLDLALATSSEHAGTRIDELYPALLGVTDAAFDAPSVEAVCDTATVAILAVPHTAALSIVPALLDRGVTVIDLSADYRLHDAATYEAWYDTAHTSPELLSEAVYGLPELDRKPLTGARLVACPGCYPTATVLAALPALSQGIATGRRVVVDAKSGVSGAGRTPTTASHYCAATDSVSAYKIAAHRHTPEMEQALGSAAGRDVRVVFAPHLVAASRGLLATVYLELDEVPTPTEALDTYRRHYENEPFVHVLDQGVLPTTAQVRGTNSAAIGVTVDARTRTLVATCAIDNLGKGAAGQGVQCLNAVLGLPETTGLDIVPGVV